MSTDPNWTIRVERRGWGNWRWRVGYYGVGRVRAGSALTERGAERRAHRAIKRVATQWASRGTFPA